MTIVLVSIRGGGTGTTTGRVRDMYTMLIKACEIVKWTDVTYTQVRALLGAISTVRVEFSPYPTAVKARTCTESHA